MVGRKGKGKGGKKCKKILARSGGRTTATMLRVGDSNHSAMRGFVWGENVYVDKVDRFDYAHGRLGFDMDVDDVC